MILIRRISLIWRCKWAQIVCNISFSTVWKSTSLRVAFILSLIVLFPLQGTWNPDTAELECDCKPKKELTFANSFYVAPNKIDFSSVFLKFSPLNQAAVMATLLLIFLIYIIIVIWARRQDRKDLLKVGNYVHLHRSGLLNIVNTSVLVTLVCVHRLIGSRQLKL